ncbi:MAG: uroporphyrinogen-III synthase [Corynebacterium sp.]|nr:uroporphyrinogen-III synthase [Corynebacterium sp.]
MADHLRSLGGTPVVSTPLRTVLPTDRTERDSLERAVREIARGHYSWVVVTSANTVRSLVEVGLTPTAAQATTWAAVGSATASALTRELGVTAEITPPANNRGAAGLVEMFPRYLATTHRNRRVFFPHSDLSNDVIPAGLTELGWDVTSVVSYHTVPAPIDPEILSAITTGDINALLITSGSGIRSLLDQAGTIPESTVIACIGTRSVAECEKLGVRVDCVAPVSNGIVLIDTLADIIKQTNK